jgi:hypothetical protein
MVNGTDFFGPRFNLFAAQLGQLRTTAAQSLIKDGQYQCLDIVSDSLVIPGCPAAAVKCPITHKRRRRAAGAT